MMILKSRFSFVVYACEKVAQPDTMGRVMVYLCPRVKIYMPYFLFRVVAWLCDVKLDLAMPLGRINHIVGHNGLLIGRFNIKGVKMVSIREKGSQVDDSCNVPERVWEALCRAAKMSKTFLIGDISRICENCKIKRLTQVEYTLLAVALKCGSPPRYWVNFQAYGSKDMDDLEDPKNIAELAAEPIVTQVAVAACDSVNNEKLCIDSRVLSIRNHVVPPTKYDGYCDEFVKLLVPTPGEGVPVGLQTVLDNQCTSVQRSRQRAEEPHVPRRNVCRAFVKNELGDKISPAHNISTMRQDHTLELSRFAYGFKQHMKQFNFYAPGCDPETIVRKIRGYATVVSLDRKAELIETDFTRFDASMSYYLRDLEFRVYKRWVATAELETLNRLLAGEINLQCYSKHGIKYEQKSSRCSGSPLTTEGNTVVNTFVAYCAYRNAGFNQEKAFSMIGPKYGDDGIDSSRGKFKQTSEDLGLTLKIMKPGPNVSFLGRLYVDVFNYDNTMSSPVKILKRSCVVNRLKDPRALADRVSGYLITDGHLPLVGHYLRALQRIYALGTPQELSKMEHDMALRHKLGPYPQDTSDVVLDLQTSMVSRLLEITGGELQTLCISLDAATSVEDLKAIKVHVRGVEDPGFKFYWN